MSEIKVNNIQSLSGTSGPIISGSVEMNSAGAMSLPRGDTAYRGGRGRGVFCGAYNAPSAAGRTTIDYVQISTLGNAVDFGDISKVENGLNSASGSSTRALIWGGYDGASPNASSNTIDYITISSTGNTFRFGGYDNNGVAAYGNGSLSDNIRSVAFGGGSNSDPSTVMQYVSIASLGNSSDFGDVLYRRTYAAGLASPTRGLFAGGFKSPSPGGGTKFIEYITIQSLGNSQDFGSLINDGFGTDSALSSSTRGVMAQQTANTNAGVTNFIEYVTIPSLGDSIDFGDLSVSRGAPGGTSNSIRGVFAGGRTQQTPAISTSNVIDYITIATLGNATDFGDRTVVSSYPAATSDSHGGLS